MKILKSVSQPASTQILPILIKKCIHQIAKNDVINDVTICKNKNFAIRALCNSIL